MKASGVGVTVVVTVEVVVTVVVGVAIVVVTAVTPLQEQADESLAAGAIGAIEVQAVVA
jgi:type III secretory pathway component EscS